MLLLLLTLLGSEREDDIITERRMAPVNTAANGEESRALALVVEPSLML